jgi:uncharacterized protein YukE
MPMGTNAGLLEQYLGRLESQCNNIRASLDSFEHIALQMRESWLGDAWTSYDLAQRKWDLQIAHIHSKIDQLRRVAHSMSENMLAADKRGSGHFH